MSSNHTLALKLDKFEGTNFHTWQVKVKFHLMRDGLWGLITKTEAKPSTREGELQWTKRDERAFSIIALALHDDFIHHIDDLETSASAWEELNKLFGAQMKNAKISLKIQFFSLMMREGTSLATHINYMRSLMSQLTGIKAQVPEDDAIAVLLKSVQDLPTYKTIVTTLQNLPDPTLQDVIAALQEEERKGNTIENGNLSTPAFTMQHANTSRGSQPPRGKGKSIMKCSICGRTNHVDKDCFYKNKDKAHLVEEDKEAETANFLDDSYAF